MHLRLEGLIENSIAWVILNVLPASIAMSERDFQSRKSSGSERTLKVIQMKSEDGSVESVLAYHSLDCGTPSLKSDYITFSKC